MKNNVNMFIEKFNIYIFLIFIFLIPHSGLHSPFMRLYQIIFIYIFVIGFLYSIQIIIKRKKYSLFELNLSILSNLFVISLIISKILALYKFNIFVFKDFITVPMVVYIPFYMIKYFKNISDIKKIYITIALLLFLTISDSIYQFLYGFDFIYHNKEAGGRLTGPFSWGAPDVGSLLGFFFFIIFYFYEKNKFKMILIVLLFLVMFILSGNRAMPISALLSFFLASFYAGKNKRFYITINVSLILVVVVIISLFFTYLSHILGDNITERLMSLSGNIWEVQQTKRIATWIQTFYMILDNPFFGVGFGNYSHILNQYLYIVPNSEGSMPHPHQFYIDLIASGGLVSFSIFSLYIFNFFKYTVLNIKNSKYKMINFMILFIIFSPLNLTHGIISLWWGIVLFIGLGLTYLNRREYNYVFKNI